MNQLWAPWRIEYIQGEKDGSCIFCTASEKEIKDSLLLFKGSFSVVMLNKYPYNNGHIMIAPVRHVARTEDVTTEEGSDIFRMISRSTTVLTALFKPDGFNIGMNVGKAAGAGIDDHLHMHVVPRWNGDVNFMPALADVKVMPEHLSATFEKLKPFFERFTGS
ncbi:MAG: HIT domain-containing protein [Deltaproteobacteria bacterium]|nr:HIT domain-containing protein [Deltaproteobacteria bacterium]